MSALMGAVEGRDADEVMKLVEAGFVDEVIKGSVPEIGVVLADSLEELAPQMLAERRGPEAVMADDVRRTYGRGIDLTEAVLRIASEMGEEYVESHFADEEGVPVVLWVLGHLQARACRIAEEALVLAKAGYGLGAYSRWRALHEVVVIASFVARQGEDVATRYVEHLAVDRLRSLELAAERAERLGEAPLPEAELEELRAEVDELVERYGRPFRSDYGWAAEALGAMEPRPAHRGFRAIEAAVQFDHLRSNYHDASSAIHAGAEIVLAPPDADHFGSTLLTGPSLAGLATPLHAVAISLVQCTGTLLTSAENWAAPFVLHTMLELSDRAGRLLAEAEQDFEQRPEADDD